ncbi:hypothetical protein ACA910_010706 [Epithemia clementina (nom. ined.)]
MRIGRYLQQHGVDDNDNNESEPSNNSSALLAFCAIFFVIMLWILPVLIRRLRQCCRSNELPTRNVARQEAFELALERMLYATEAEFVRTLLRQEPEPDHHARRKDYLERVLMKKKFGEYKSDTKDTEECISDSEKLPKDNQRSNNLLGLSTQHEANADEADDDANEEDEETDHDMCSICLCKYEQNDDVTWSTNKLCRHVFHRDCIAEWLQKKEECPVCRRFFLHFEDEESGGTDSGHVPVDPSAGEVEVNSILDVFREMGRVYRLMQLAGTVGMQSGVADPAAVAARPDENGAGHAEHTFTPRSPPGMIGSRHHRVHLVRGGRAVPSSLRVTRRDDGDDVEQQLMMVRSPPGRNGNI